MKTVLRDEAIGYVGFDNEYKLPFVIEKEDLSKEELFYFRIVKNENIPSAQLNGPIYLSLFPTLECNKNCNFCYYTKLLNKGSKNELTMNIDTAKKLVRFCCDNGILMVNIIGGEPLLPNVWEINTFIIKNLLKNGISVSLLTNGINLHLFAKEISDIYCEFNNQFNLIVSTNPDDKDELFFSKLQKGFELAQTYKLPFSINTIVLSDNSKYYYEYFNSLNDKYGDVIKEFNLLYPRVSDELRMKISEFKILCIDIKERTQAKVDIEIPYQFKYDSIKTSFTKIDLLNTGCGIGRRTIAASPIGKLYVCDCFINNKGYYLGSLDDSLKNIWTNAINLRTKINFKVTPTSCKTHCQFYEICEGCLAEIRENVHPVCEYKQTNNEVNYAKK